MAAGSRPARGHSLRQRAAGGSAQPQSPTAAPAAPRGRPASAAAMSLGPGESASETKAKKKSFRKPPPPSPKSPYHSKPRKVASWRSLRTATSMPLGNRTSLTPQTLWLGSSKQGHVPGTLVYREKEDMYDEIIELKKVVNGLKQRILKLEQQCKEKDNAINKLQTDIKTTNLEEMRIAMETYYEEIHRLQTLLATSEPTGRKPPVEKKISLKRQKKMSSALLSLSRSVQELTEENQSLKEDLDRVLSSSPTVSKTKGICPRATQGGRHEERGYMEWSKPRLLRRISELEKKISLMESPKSPASEVVQAGFPADSSSSSTVHRQPRSDRHEEGERLRGAVKSLKGERNALQSQLQEKELEVKQLLQTKADLQKELGNMKEGEKERREREEALREEIQTLTKKFQELVELKKEEKDDVPEVTPESQEEPQPSRLASSPAQQDAEPQASGEGSRARSPGSEGRRDTAARLLQARWKVYRHKKKKAALDEAATVLQAAFRGHLARAKLLSSKACGSESPSVPSLPSQNSPLPCSASPVVEAEGDPGQEEAITVIQSVFRAHLAQARLSAASHRAATAAPPRRRSALAAPREPSSPPCPAASPGQEDSEVSSGETVEGPAAEDEAPRPWGPGEPAAPQPCSAESSPTGLQPMAPPPPDDVHSDDSDEIVMAPSLPTRKSAPPP
ncbi:IQ domain-containing protein E isoform X14 [Equus przewalskii]|uniref:IQ domain-containing protein E isoform X14 n=1 Tax=Equus przewalskii TaxID=9798 RepID=A0ABM4K277_EQUPR